MTVALESLKPEAEKIVAQYDQKRAAMLPVLRLLQERLGHVAPEA